MRKDIILNLNINIEELPFQTHLWEVNYVNRLNYHTDLVLQWYDKIISKFEIEKIDIELHDYDKRTTPLFEIFTAYNAILIQELNLNEYPYLKQALNTYTIVHITENPHHPEYWDLSFSLDKFNLNDRNNIPKKPVNATLMPIRYVNEMLADWFAMASEKKSNPWNWFNKINRKRYIFDEEIELYIKEILSFFWGKNPI